MTESLMDELKRIQSGRPKRQSHNEYLRKLADEENRRMARHRTSMPEHEPVDCSLESILSEPHQTNMMQETAEREIIDSMFEVNPDLALRMRQRRR